MSSYPVPKPFFDTLENLCDQYKQCQKEGYQSIVLPWIEKSLVDTGVELPSYHFPAYLSNFPQLTR